MADEMPRDRIWHVLNDDQTSSPATDEALHQRIIDGSIGEETLLWRPGMSEWMPAGRVPGLLIPPSLPNSDTDNPPQKDQPSISSEAVVHIAATHSGASLRQMSFPSMPQQRERRRSYIARHWRGELPLGVSYWVNGLLVSLLLTLGGALLGAADITQAPRLITATVAAFNLFIVIVSTWQLVGIWRSAGRRIIERRARGRGAPWARLAQIATVFGFIGLIANTLVYRFPNAWANLQIAFGDDPTPPHILRVLNGGSEIELAGGIDFGTSAGLRTLLDATPQARVIDLASGGGRIAEAEHVRDLIRARHLATYTAAVCASACTVAYMGGYPRFLGPGGQLGFHRYAFPGLTAEQDTVLNQKGEQDLIDAGVSRDLAAKAFATPSTRVWFPERAQLLAAHVVTQEVNGWSFSAAAVGNQPLNAESAARMLTANASFAAFRRADPTSFAKAVDGMVSGVQQGKSLQDVMMEARAPLLAAVAQSRPFASDAIQQRIAALTSEEAKLLAADHPDACITLLYGTKQDWVGYASYLPPNVVTRENELTADIIDSGFSHIPQATDTPQDAQVELARLWSQVRESGVDVSGVGKNPATTEEKSATCIAMAELFARVAALPAPRSGALMRYLFAASR